MDSLLVGYDGDRNVKEERSVGQKKLVRKAEPPSKRRKRWPRWTGFRGMTVRDWLPIVVALFIPVVIALGTWRITWQQGQIEDQRARAEQKVAEQRAQDEALQAYLSQMSGLLLKRDLRASEMGSEVRTLARARTLTVLGRLDPSRKAAVILFLAEADLVQNVEIGPIIGLSGANLSGADLNGANLSGADLTGANLSHANLNGVILDKALLTGANLSYAKLGAARLSRADLTKANLADADLSGAELRFYPYTAEAPTGAFAKQAYLAAANLSGADLSGVILSKAVLADANLSHAELVDTTLSGTDMSSADLTEANLTKANLNGAYEFTSKARMHKRLVDTQKLEEQAASLKGATMPDGQKYED